jgi:ubiquinone/menaquinone biosynthesis C-methylase UbiE
MTIKKMLRNIRSVFTFWTAEQTLAHLESIRTFELNLVLKLLPRDGKILEIGAGTGWQAQALENRGYVVSAIDLASSNYAKDRMWPITEYDGKIIPFVDHTFDIIFSSNTLVMIPGVVEFQKEIMRVLKPGGFVLHALPSSSWRFWSNITYFLKRWRIPVQGAHARNAILEIFYFSRGWWIRLFRRTGWIVVGSSSNCLFYTGASIMDSRLGMSARNKLSHILGGSCNFFILRKKEQA